jgi:hypothetical protein
VIFHSLESLKEKLREIFREIAFISYDFSGQEGIFESIFKLDVVTQKKGSNYNISIVDIRVNQMPYRAIIDFEKHVVDEEDILEFYKTNDSFKVEENATFLKELCAVEMKVREIYTVLSRLQEISLQNSRARTCKDYQKNDEENTKARLINEYFFLEFSDYKNVDKRKEPSLADLLTALKQCREAGDISRIATELSHSTLHLEERFNELSNIPEAIGRVENFRNIIAHNRYLKEDDIEKFRTAQSIIETIHSNFVKKLQNGTV